MPKVVTKLNNTQIKNTKPGDKELNLFDGDGLFLRISPTVKGGKKNWYFRYAVPVTKKRTKISLGTYPHLHPRYIFIQEPLKIQNTKLSVLSLIKSFIVDGIIIRGPEKRKILSSFI